MGAIVGGLNKALLHDALTTALHMVFNRAMTTQHRDAALIKALGGAAEVARRLDLDSAKGVQRVHNWTVRGIPAAVRLQHLEIFGQPGSMPVESDLRPDVFDPPLAEPDATGQGGERSHAA